MRIAFFGGTFDPVHLGHLAVARAAADEFGLNLIYFTPADIPPHKQKRALADFHHRYAMLALATAGDKRFVPSLMDAHTGKPNYSYETIVRLKKKLSKSDKLYFLIGLDAFKEISTWYKPVELLGECDFIVVSRPGHSMKGVAQALPKAVRPQIEFVQKLQTRGVSGAISMSTATIHLMNYVRVPVSSTQIRAAARKSLRQLSRYVPGPVAEYIRKERLYIEKL